MKAFGFLIAAACIVGAAAAAEPVAMVTDLKGSVTQSAQKAERLALLSYLEPGARLRLDAGASLVITYFARATQVALAGPAEALVEAGGVRMLSGAPPQIRSLDAASAGAAKKFEPLQRDRLAMATFQMRGAKPRPQADAATAKRLAAARPAPGAPFSERLLYAVQLETAGLADEARQAWAALAKERPDDPGLKEWLERR